MARRRISNTKTQKNSGARADAYIINGLTNNPKRLPRLKKNFMTRSGLPQGPLMPPALWKRRKKQHGQKSNNISSRLIPMICKNWWQLYFVQWATTSHGFLLQGLIRASTY